MNDEMIPKAKISPRLPPVSRIAVGSLTVSPMQANLPIDRAAGVLAYAFERGLNFIDTAQYYENYNIIREALKRTDDPDGIVISTKTYAYSRSLAIEAVEEARRRLDRDVIDIFMLHEQESYYTLKGHMEALDYLFECREKGIVRAVGASTHHVALARGMMQLLDEGYTPDVIHPLYNMAGIGIADGGEEDMALALTSLHEKGVGIFAMKALGGGHLCTKAEDALGFVISKPFIDSVAIGMQSEAEVDSNIRFLLTGSFSEEDREALGRQKRTLHVEEYCEGCGACVKRCASKALILMPRGESGDGAQTGEFVREQSGFYAVPDDSKCVRCGYCTKVCPVFALKIY